ncbi:serine hydrolase domain-containing protein [Catenulispora sp. GP43]|uniref:serine hydrolase domain-containing protein n=1 Tax=Catenulispora sp. GP43 TaxID=3156263 RepID=UPI00351946F2
MSGEIPSASADEKFAPRLAEGRNIGAVIAKRFAGFRDAAPTIVTFDRTGDAAAAVVVRSGDELWEFAIGVEPAEPYRIRSFRPRPVPADAPEWTDLVDQLRRLDHAVSELPGSLAEQVHQHLAAVVAEDRIPGLSCGIAVDGEVVHREYLGTGDVRTLTRLDAGAVFRVGSVTKLVTALAVLDLVREGRLDLDAPLGPEAGFDATVGDVLLHRAGLPKDLTLRRDTAALPQSLADALALLPPARPSSASGRPEYSNLGYELLGLLVEQVTGAPFAEHCAGRVLARYGLAGAHFSGPGTPAPSTVVGSEAIAGRIAPVAEAAEPYRFAGGMTADLDSVLTLAGVVGRAGDPLAEALLAHTAPAGPGASFIPGATLLDRADGPILWRGGSTRGFTAELMAAVDGSAAVVLLGASSTAAGLRQTAEGLLRVVG